MRGALGLIGLLLALAIVGVLVKQQLGATRQLPPVLPNPVTGVSPDLPASAAPTTVREQSQQIQQQYKQAVEAAMQPQRSASDGQ